MPWRRGSGVLVSPLSSGDRSPGLPLVRESRNRCEYRLRLGYYCSSLRTENLCRPIVLLCLYISRFLVEMSFHLTLRGINHEQKDAVQQLFESNGWPWNVEMTDVCETESTAHSSRLDDIRRSQPLALALNWRPTFSLPVSRGSESAECEFCFCVFVFHVSPPAVRVGSGRGSQPINETLGLGKRCTESFGVCLRYAILGDIKHIFTKEKVSCYET